MANLLQSSQAKTTEAPDYYKNYLSGLATSATGMMPGGACAPEYVGAQPLQEKAFTQACQGFGAQQGAITTGKQYLGQAAGEDITGAAAPYLKAGTSTSPLSAMTPYAQSAMCTTGYEAGMEPIAKATGLSGLTAASPFLGRAAGTCGACVSSQYVDKATGMNAAQAAQDYLTKAAQSGGINYADPIIQQALKMSGATAASPYRQQAAAKGGACAAQNYLTKGACADITGAASPFIKQAAAKAA